MFDSLTPEEVYAILCARIKNTAIGLGAVKGAPCTISSIQKIDGGNIVTFQWTGTNGKIQTSTMKVLDGTGGSGNCDSNTCECIRYTNLKGSAVNVGGIVKGDKFDNVTIQQVIDKLLSAPYTPPQVTISLSCKNMYAVEDLNTINMPIKITANTIKKTNDIISIKFYANNVLISTITSSVASGGSFSTNYNVAISNTVTFKVVAEDGVSSATASSTVKVVNSSYVGYVHGGTIIDSSVVKSLTKIVKDTKIYKYDNVLMPTDDTYHIVYAYPKTFGLITSIKDGMNFEYIQDYDLSELVIDGCNYYVCKLRIPVCVTSPGFFQQFS